MKTGIKLTLLLFFNLLWINCLISQPKTISIKDFLRGVDTTPAVYEALKHCKNIKADKLIFPKGRYEFWPDYATEKFISQNRCRL